VQRDDPEAEHQDREACPPAAEQDRQGEHAPREGDQDPRTRRAAAALALSPVGAACLTTAACRAPALGHYLPPNR
jgi:hypothetical protein